MSKIFLLSLVFGALSGVIAALCGVGGGVVLVPLFVGLLGLDQKTAVATSLAAIILTSISATVKNSGNHYVDWRVTIPCALTAALVAWFAADWLKALQNATLNRIFAILLISVGVKMLIWK